MDNTDMINNQENSITPAEAKPFALAPMDVSNVGSALKENLGGQCISPLDFDRLSFPAA